MATNYTELVRMVPIWLYAENASIKDEMPKIIEQAQDMLLQSMDHDLFKTIIPGLTVGTDGLLDLTQENPRVLEVRGVRVQWRDRDDGWTPLQPREHERLTAMFNNDRPGRPRYYTEYDEPLSLKLFPKPSDIINVEVTANVEPLKISQSVATNIYTEQFPRALERACLHYGAYFMKNWEDAAQYEKDMMKALQEAGAAIGRRRRDETGTRPRQTQNVQGQ
jgi:hypothetical protein